LLEQTSQLKQGDKWLVYQIIQPLIFFNLWFSKYRQANKPLPMWNPTINA